MSAMFIQLPESSIISLSPLALASPTSVLSPGWEVLSAALRARGRSGTEQQ
jgi:hypothetical protein